MVKRFALQTSVFIIKIIHENNIVISIVINSNIINKVINISLIILSEFIIIEFGPPMSLF